MDSAHHDARLPVTVLSGFLGAGKTTLLTATLVMAIRRAAAVSRRESPPAANIAGARLAATRLAGLAAP